MTDVIEKIREHASGTVPNFPVIPMSGISRAQEVYDRYGGTFRRLSMSF